MYLLLLFLQVASTKGNEKVGKWSNQIINHFWYCCSIASEYEDTTQALGAMKVDTHGWQILVKLLWLNNASCFQMSPIHTIQCQSRSPHPCPHTFTCSALISAGVNSLITSVDHVCLVSQDKWLSILHHVCSEHEWATGKCDHEALDPNEEHPPWFDRRDQDFLALQKVVLEPTLLDSFKFYAKFR